MSEQQLHDDLENIVIQLKKVIPALQNLTNLATDNIDEKLEQSLTSINLKLRDLSNATVNLSDTTDKNIRFIQTADRQALEHLKRGVELLTQTDITSEYREQITAIVSSIEPLLMNKINEGIEQLTDAKKVSLEIYNNGIDDINKQLKDDVKTTVKKLSDAIEKLNTVATKISGNADTELTKLKTVSTAHTDALERVKNNTDTTALDMIKTLNSIKSQAILMAQTPVSLSVLFIVFFNLSFLIALTYKFNLWLPVIVSALSLFVLVGAIYGICIGIEKMQENE